MISFELRGLRRTYHPMHISCKLGDMTVWGITTDISSKGFCLEVPTPRIKMCLLDLLNKDVILEIQNVIIDGSIEWYTIEADRYCIGISINKWHIPTWKKLLAVSGSPVVDSGMEHAQI
jgi:hypothetical protein